MDEFYHDRQRAGQSTSERSSKYADAECFVTHEIAVNGNAPRNLEEGIDLRLLGSGLKDARATAIVKSELFEAVRLVVHTGAEIRCHSAL